MVEVAFELLCGEASSSSASSPPPPRSSTSRSGDRRSDEADDDEDSYEVAEAEFADQCRVFAASLLELPPHAPPFPPPDGPRPMPPRSPLP
jgi:hypothetical protein